MQAQRTAMERNIARFTAERLERELAFAEGFNDESDPNAVAWLAALRAECDRRANG